MEEGSLIEGGGGALIAQCSNWTKIERTDDSHMRTLQGHVYRKN